MDSTRQALERVAQQKRNAQTWIVNPKDSVHNLIPVADSINARFPQRFTEKINT
jgi:hypothetical protein